MRRIVTLAALAVPALLCAGLGAPAALAADDCPNAAVRAQQNATHLPNCLAYEKVTPDEKGGALPLAETKIAADGSGIVYLLNAGVEDAQSFTTGKYRSLRTDSGWGTNALMPPVNPDGPWLPKLNDGISMQAASADLARVVVDTGYPVNPHDKGIEIPAVRLGSQDLYRREADGTFTWVTNDPSVDDSSSAKVNFVAASTDLDRVVVRTTRQWDPRVTTGVNHLYVWSQEHGAQLATVLPNGDVPTDVPTGSPNDGADQKQAVSADGRRVAFTVGTGTSQRVYVRFNADDPARATTSEVAVGPHGEACVSSESHSTFQGLSADGTKMVFRCSNALVPGAPTGGQWGATYMRDLDGGQAALRLVGALDVSARQRPASSDFSRIYFKGTLVRDGVMERAVPPFVSSDPKVEFWREAASADGQYYAFLSAYKYGLTGIDGGASGTSQVYLYSARTGDFTCVSCRQDGAPTAGEASVTVGTSDIVTPVSSRGTVVFTSTTALVPEDTNGIADAYVWEDGRAVLLSSGRNGAISEVMGSSDDGNSFFFRTPDSMTPDDIDNGEVDLYVARSGGGFLVPEAPAACQTGCQAPGPERPSLPGLGSADFVGRGNLLEDVTEPAKRASAALTASRSVRGTSTVVRVKVSRAGSIRVSGVGLRQATVKAKKAGTYRVTVRLSAFGSAQQKKRGRLATKLTARFIPDVGASVQAGKSVTFTATKKGGR